MKTIFVYRCTECGWVGKDEDLARYAIGDENLDCCPNCRANLNQNGIFLDVIEIYREDEQGQKIKVWPVEGS